jgi:hypothetical protein
VVPDRRGESWMVEKSHRVVGGSKAMLTSAGGYDFIESQTTRMSASRNSMPYIL